MKERQMVNEARLTAKRRRGETQNREKQKANLGSAKRYKQNANAGSEAPGSALQLETRNLKLETRENIKHNCHEKRGEQGSREEDAKGAYSFVSDRALTTDDAVIRRLSWQGGVTLLELLITIVIILILGVMGIVEYTSMDKRAHRDGKLPSVEALAKAVQMYKFDYKAYPPDSSSVDILMPYTNVTSLKGSFDASAATPAGGVDIRNIGGSGITVYVRALIKGVNTTGAGWGANGSYMVKYYILPGSGDPSEGGKLVCKWLDKTGSLIHDWQACEKGL